MWKYYKVKWYDEYDNEEKTAAGIVIGNEYVDAVANVVNGYGKDCVISVMVEEFGEFDCKCVEVEELETVLRRAKGE